MGIIPFITAVEIADRVQGLGQEITGVYKGQKPVLIGALKGSFIFMADLTRHIDLPISMDFVGASSRPDGTESTGEIKITKELSESIDGKDIIFVEDIIDTGLTADYWIRRFRDDGANSIRVCTLLHKPARTEIPVKIDFLGFTIEDKFVVGYGMDYSQEYRNLSYIGVLDI